MERGEKADRLPEAATFDEISAYSSLIEKYVNQNWNRENPTGNLFRVTLLTITKRERVEQLHGQYNYCWLTLELGREIRECVACFWQPDEPVNPQMLYELKGVFEVGRKLTL
ncbi:MAG: hypothetical protein QHH30_10445 [candidate division NC10 bacterium]|nr:hypothetical protein [candidate division NC10 bacterium]